MVILDPYDMTFDDVGVFGLAFHLLFRSWSTYCAAKIFFGNPNVLEMGQIGKFSNEKSFLPLFVPVQN